MPGHRKLIVVEAFDRNEKGELISASEPRRMQSEAAAIYQAQTLINDHDGVVAWSREGQPGIGEEGPTIILFQCGDIPEFE
ncbi:hypothetical protein [Rhizobium tubonense]|uniref:Uncharacterized protein n=1 Tax=Rhizobium tubonense TaxID=484088 RepID=A0A2W4CC13_9HYPH|nr:hypothetical protein [Rhizobium tubonense]PZM10341.1 hypothetical protein CPY51_23610 [Rhizobium tubonense]